MNKNLILLYKKSQVIILLLFLSSILTGGGEKLRIRPLNWAQPVIGTNLQNFFIIDSLLFRSSQPDRDNFLLIQKYGIKEVLNLRHYHSDNNSAKGTKLILYRVKMDAAAIQLPEVIEALKIIKSKKGPLLIHCKHGSDRTGLITAMYRIIFQNWTKDDAIDEMVNGGYGFHKMYKGIIEFIRDANIEEIKKSINS